MANITVHIAIAQEWAKNHKVENLDDFIWGAVAPDVLSWKMEGGYVTHYGDKVDVNTALDENLMNKTHLDRYLAKNKLSTDYDKGYFLHLVTDLLFYNDFIDVAVLQKYYDEHNGEIKQCYYHDYDCTLEFVTNAFNVNYQNTHREVVDLQNRYGKCAIKDSPWLYSEQQLADFIVRVAKIDLERLAQKIVLDKMTNTNAIIELVHRLL